MRKLIRRIVEGYKSLKLERQEEGYVLFSGKEADTMQTVWIKVLPVFLGKDPQIAARFQGLARTIRQLNHPNIAAIRKVGEESGLPYLITRAIERGQPLAAKLDQPWAVDTAADVVMQVGQALEHAYNKGLVHGSLSPEKIIVQDNGKVMVADFGLSELQSLLGVQIKEAASPYLAPERADGQTAGARADVYSLAAVLYAMLAERSPKVSQGQVLPPSRFNPDIPPAMDKVVVQALAPDAADRYPDVRSFLAALGAVTLAPAVKRDQSAPAVRTRPAGARCAHCGAEDQTSRFCRTCGARLEQPRTTDLPASASPPTSHASLDRSTLDTNSDTLPSPAAGRPIQVTRVEVGRVEAGKDAGVREAVIARPIPVISDDLYNQFPEPLEMPRLDMSSLWPTMDDKSLIAVPEPPSMPVIDWAEIMGNLDCPPMPIVSTIEDTGRVSQDDD